MMTPDPLTQLHAQNLAQKIKREQSLGHPIDTVIAHWIEASSQANRDRLQIERNQYRRAVGDLTERLEGLNRNYELLQRQNIKLKQDLNLTRERLRAQTTIIDTSRMGIHTPAFAVFTQDLISGINPLITGDSTPNGPSGPSENHD